jgi:hypothetical protein
MVEASMRPYRAGDEGPINDGFNEVFGLQRTLGEWRWKFREVGTRSAIMLALEPSGDILAHYAAIVVPLRVGERTVRAGQIVDIYSRRRAREGLAAARVFRETVQRFVAEFCSAEGLAVTYGFPGPRHLSLVRLGVASHGEAEMTPQPLQLWTRSSALRGSLWPRHDVREGFEASTVDALWSRAGARYAIGVVRDASWLSRRFVGRPGVEYVHLSARRRGVVHAWAVVRPGAPVTSLAELVWDGEASGALLALDREVGRLARGAGAERVEMWLAGDTRAADVFGQSGWSAAPHPVGLHMTAYTFDPRLDPGSFPGNFYLTMGDADLV